MLCKDIFEIIGSYLCSLNDVISLHNVNKVTRSCKYDIFINTRRRLPEFIYNDYNIVKVCSIFSDYSNVTKLLTDKLVHLSVSHRNKNDINILNKLPDLINLKTLRMYSNKFTDLMFINTTKLISLDLGFQQSSNFTGSSIAGLDNLTFLNLGDNCINADYINHLTKLEHLSINTIIRDYDFSLLTNLKTLDVSKSDYTLINSNIEKLYNLKNLRCKYSAISDVNHLINLEVLFLGVNYVLQSVALPNLKILSIIDSKVNYINSPTLIELTLNELITDDILKKHIELSYLYIGANTIITDEGIKPLVNLKYIHCNLNRNITSDGLLNATKLVYLHAGLSCIIIDQLINLINLQYAEQYDPYLGNLESVILLDNRITIK